jgi:hypothetical protein
MDGSGEQAEAKQVGHETHKIIVNVNHNDEKLCLNLRSTPGRTPPKNSRGLTREKQRGHERKPRLITPVPSQSLSG